MPLLGGIQPVNKNVMIVLISVMRRAIPYFDYFLTERSLSQLLSDGNLRLRKHFNCIVVSDVGGALRTLAPLEH
jgi:hypothetical protein